MIKPFYIFANPFSKCFVLSCILIRLPISVIWCEQVKK